MYKRNVKVTHLTLEEDEPVSIQESSPRTFHSKAGFQKTRSIMSQARTAIVKGSMSNPKQLNLNRRDFSNPKPIMSKPRIYIQ